LLAVTTDRMQAIKEIVYIKERIIKVVSPLCRVESRVRGTFRGLEIQSRKFLRPPNPDEISHFNVY
jgi:hypothetical protein